MELNEFLEKFADLFDETDESDIKVDTKYKELDEWSSLEALCIISLADEEFDVQLKNSDLKDTETVEDLYKLILSKTK